MVLPLDPALHDMAKYIAEQHVEIAGPFYRRLNNELIYSLFRNNEDPIDKIFTKSLEKFLFSKAEIENTFMDLQRFSETGEEMTPEIRNRLAIMGAMGIRPSEFASEWTNQTPRGDTPIHDSGTPYAGVVTGGGSGVQPSITPLSGNTDINSARRTAEEYLGQSISDEEWDMLVRATFSEATSNPTERAAVMGVILNRVRSSSYPNTIRGVLHQRNQFQAVTGTRYDRRPSRQYSMNRSPQELQSMADAINSQLFDFADQGWLNFTSNITGAYGAGTNIGFRSRVRNAAGSSVIGGTVFGTVSGTPASPPTRSSSPSIPTSGISSGHMKYIIEGGIHGGLNISNQNLHAHGPEYVDYSHGFRPVWDNNPRRSPRTVN
jgi:hypothetical protein